MITFSLLRVINLYQGVINSKDSLVTMEAKRYYHYRLAHFLYKKKV